MLVLVEIEFNYHRISQQYHLDQPTTIALQSFQEIAIKLAKYWLRTELIDKPIQFNFYTTSIIDWYYLFSIRVNHLCECILEKDVDYDKIIKSAVEKTQNNRQYQETVAWLNENHWTHLQYHNSRYWAVPPNSYMPICIPNFKISYNWEDFIDQPLPRTHAEILLMKSAIISLLSLGVSVFICIRFSLFNLFPIFLFYAIVVSMLVSVFVHQNRF